MSQLSEDKVSLLADYLTNHSRCFGKVRNEFLEKFHVDDWPQVTKVLAIFLHNSSFVNQGKLTRAIDTSSTCDGDEKLEDSSFMTPEMKNNMKKQSLLLFAIEHAYAAAILSVTDRHRLIAGSELTKLEYLLKSDLILRSGDSAPQEHVRHLNCMKAMWLFGDSIPPRILSMNGSDFFSMSAKNVEALFRIPPLSEAPAEINAYPIFSLPQQLNRPEHEEYYHSYGSMKKLLLNAQVIDEGPYCGKSIIPRPIFSSMDEMCAYFSSKEKNDSSECLNFLSTLQKGYSLKLQNSEEIFLVNLAAKCPELPRTAGIIPSNVLALVTAGNVRIAYVILECLASTQSFSLFLSAFLNPSNLHSHSYKILLLLEKEKYLPKRFLETFLQLGFKEYGGSESNTPQDFSPENDSFATFCLDLLKKCAIDPALVCDDMRRYCVLHQGVPKVVELFSLLQDATEWL